MANSDTSGALHKHIGDPVTSATDPGLIDMLFSGGLTPDSLTYTGSLDAAALLPEGYAISEVGGGEVVSIDRGVFLTTGGEPGTENTSPSFTVVLGEPGNTLLDAAAQAAFPGAGATNDAALLTFTFDAADVSGAPSISFDLFFGSDEYPEFVDSSFVDIAAVVVNGVNYAVFNNDPGQPVSIVGESINTPGNFFDNEDISTPERDGIYDTEYDGFSVLLTVVAPVQAGANEVVIGIADTGDFAYDSGLFVGNVQASNFTVEGSFINLQGTASNDNIQTNNAPELISLGGGQDTVSGTPEQLDGDVIDNFGSNDQLIVQGAAFDQDDLTVTLGSAILDIDTDGDGTDDTTVTLQGNFEGADFTVTNDGGNTSITASNVPDEGISETGTAGADTLTGTAQNDTLDGGAGDDRLEGGDGNDELLGGDGNDGILGGAGDDAMSGGAGNDNMAASDGNDLVEGEGGNDFMGGGLGDDTMDGGTGDDFMGGGQGNDEMDGGDDDDVVNGGAGNDRLIGGAGNDTMGASFNNDTVIGGEGNDNMGGGTGSDEIRAGLGDDQVGGGEGNDTIAGGGGNDFLAGGGRDDEINGGGGNDTINAGTGDDTITGGADADLFVFRITDGDADVVTDFEDGVDMFRLIGVAGATDEEKLDALTAVDTAAGALVSYEGHTILIEGVLVDNLGAEDVIFA